MSNNPLFADTNHNFRQSILALLKRHPDGLTLTEIAEGIGISLAKTLLHLNDLAAAQKCDRRGNKYKLIPTSHTEENLGKRLAIAAEKPIPRSQYLTPLSKKGNNGRKQK